MNSRSDEHRRAQRRVLIGICVVAVLAVAVFLLRRPASQATTVKEMDVDVTLNGAVSCSGDAIQITNNGGVGWMDARVEINSKYSRVVPSIPQNQTVTLPTAEFTDSNGKRFNPAAVECQSADIQAFVRGGRGHLTVANLGGQ
jgi:hypothetical protein